MKEDNMQYNLIKSKIDRLIKEGHCPKATNGGYEIDNIHISRLISNDKDYYPLSICGQNFDYSLSVKSRKDLYWYLKNMMPCADTYLSINSDKPRPLSWEPDSTKG